MPSFNISLLHITALLGVACAVANCKHAVAQSALIDPTGTRDLGHVRPVSDAGIRLDQMATRCFDSCFQGIDPKEWHERSTDCFQPCMKGVHESASDDHEGSSKGAMMKQPRASNDHGHGNSVPANKTRFNKMGTQCFDDCFHGVDSKEWRRRDDDCFQPCMKAVHDPEQAASARNDSQTLVMAKGRRLHQLFFLAGYTFVELVITIGEAGAAVAEAAEVGGAFFYALDAVPDIMEQLIELGDVWVNPGADEAEAELLRGRQFFRYGEWVGQDDGPYLTQIRDTCNTVVGHLLDLSIEQDVHAVIEGNTLEVLDALVDKVDGLASNAETLLGYLDAGNLFTSVDQDLWFDAEQGLQEAVNNIQNVGFDGVVAPGTP